MAQSRNGAPTAAPVDAVDPATYAAVQSLYAHQTQSMDRADAAGFTATFTEDAVFSHVSSGEVLHGRAAIAEALLLTAQRRRGAVHRHWFGQLALVPTGGPGELAARYYAIVSATGPDGSVRWDPSCVVEDVLVEVGGRWLTRSRTVLRDDLLLR